MISLLLMRSGRSEYDCQGRIQGTLDIPLSKEGRQLVENLATELDGKHVDAIYVVPGEAAEQTAEIIASAFQQKVKKLSELHNWNLGLWQGMLVEDVKSKQPKVYRQWQEHPETVCPPEGEPLHAIRERVEETLAKVLKKHKQGVLGLVLPDPLYSVVRNILLDEELGDLWQSGGDERPAWETIHLNPDAETLRGLVAEEQASS